MCDAAVGAPDKTKTAVNRYRAGPVDQRLAYSRRGRPLGVNVLQADGSIRFRARVLAPAPTD